MDDRMRRAWATASPLPTHTLCTFVHLAEQLSRRDLSRYNCDQALRLWRALGRQITLETTSLLMKIYLCLRRADTFVPLLLYNVLVKVLTSTGSFKI